MDINIRDIQLSECIVQVFIIGGLSKQMSQAQVPLILRLKHKHLIRCHRIMLLHKKKATLSSKSLQPTSSDCSVHNANIFTHTGIAQGFRGGGGVPPYISYIGMCCPIRQGFCAVLVRKWVTLCPFWSGIRYVSRGSYGSV